MRENVVLWIYGILGREKKNLVFSFMIIILHKSPNSKPYLIYKFCFNRTNYITTYSIISL